MDWTRYFDVVAQVQELAEAAGVPRPRARRLAEEVAARPVARRRAARLLLRCAERRGAPVDLARLSRLVARHDRRVAERLSTPGADDPVVRAAHALLARLEPDACPPLADVRVGATPNADAACYEGLIVVDPQSPYYRSGDPLDVAMLLHHEYFHARNGSDERAARAASARFLERHRP
jgi:hypothetical protein